MSLLLLLLLDITLRTSAIVLVGLAAARLLRRRSAALRHGILACTLFAAAIVIPLRLIAPAWDVHVPGWMTTVASRLSAATAAAAGGAGLGGASAAHGRRPGAGAARVDAAGSAAALEAKRAPDGIPAEAVAGADASSRGLAWRSITTNTFAIAGAAIPPIVALVWAAGAAISATLLLAGFIRLMRIGARATRVESGPWARAAEQLASAYGLRRPVTLLQSDAPDVLGTWGLGRPRILLPAHARDWSDERIRVVLAHELAHIRRGDWLVQMGAETLRTLHWGNPLLWLACARLRRESEQACDDDVLRTGVTADAYAAHLLDVARSSRRPTVTWATAMPMARPSTLEGRIAAMLNPGIDRRRLSPRALVVAASLLVGLALPTAALRGAQGGSPALGGAVYDATGAALPQVEMTLVDAQQRTLVATTDASGRFQFESVAPGAYVLEAKLMGFRPLKLDLELREPKDWDRALTLDLGQVSEVITVRESRVRAGEGARVPGARTSSPSPGLAPIRVGGNIKQPTKIAHTKPIYPPAMREAGREGKVPIEAVIGADGSVLTLRVLSADLHPDFAIAAVDAVRQWRYTPTLLNGKPVAVVMTVAVTFSLGE